MTAHAPRLLSSVDPLIADARRRTRQRRAVAALLLALVLAVVSAWLALRLTGAPEVNGIPPSRAPAKGTVTALKGAGVLTDNVRDSFVAFGIALVSRKERAVELPVPVGPTISHLHVVVNTPAGAGASWTFTVDKKGSATALNCSIEGGATNCRDFSRVHVSPGDMLDLDVTPLGKPALATVTWSARITR